MKLPIVFILLSFLSSFGDTIFLTGLPLYFFKESGGSILDTTFVSVIITLAVLFSRKWIISLNQRHPLLITAYGELGMAAIELVILVLYAFFQSKWIVVAGVFPLAIIYNIYAPAKFFKLQDYFFPENAFYLTAWQSAVNRLGILSAIFVSGWVVLRWDIEGILIIDGITFTLFGGMTLWGYKRFGNRLLEINRANQTGVTVHHRSRSALTIGLILISLATLFSSWETASSVAIGAKVSGLGVDEAAALRAAIGGLGVIIGLLISRFFQALSFYFWISTLFMLTVGLFIVGSVGIAGTYLLFFFGGLLACIELPVQRQLYGEVAARGGDSTAVSSSQWIYNSALSLSLIFIGFASDQANFMSLNPLQISAAVITVVGLLGGFVIYKNIPGVPR